MDNTDYVYIREVAIGIEDSLHFDGVNNTIKSTFDSFDQNQFFTDT